MNVDPSINIVINDNNTFYISDSQSNSDSPIDTLSKIERIVREKLEYDPIHKDAYSKLSKQSLFETLAEKSSRIHENYSAQQAKSSSLWRSLFSEEKKVAEINTRIHNLVLPRRTHLPLEDNDAMSLVGKFLTPEDLAKFSRTSRGARLQAGAAMIQLARKYGYKGNNPIEAPKYINALFKQSNSFFKYNITRGMMPVELLKDAEREMAGKWRELLDSNAEPAYTADEYGSRWSSMREEASQLKAAYNAEKWERATQSIIKSNIINVFCFSEILGEETTYTPKYEVFRAAIEAKLHNIDFKDPSFQLPREIESSGLPALILATKYGSVNMVEFFLKCKVNPNKECKVLEHYRRQLNGKFALPFACGSGISDNIQPNIKIVSLLLDYKADPNIPDSQGTPPLNSAVRVGQKEIVILLLDHGAKINATDKQGQTALMEACRMLSIVNQDQNHSDYLLFSTLVELLLDREADPNIPDARGNTPLKLATNKGNVALTQLLIQHGASDLNDQEE